MARWDYSHGIGEPDRAVYATVTYWLQILQKRGRMIVYTLQVWR